MTLPSFLKLGQIAKKTFPLLAEHAFLTFLALIFVAFMFSLILFYGYVWVPLQQNPQDIQTETNFQRDAFNGIVKLREERKTKFENANSLQLRNLFQF